MTSAATAAGGGTGRRGGSNRQREENNWPEATREREVTWLLSWPKAREGSSRKGWSPQSGSALRCSWWVPILWPSSAPFSPPPFRPLFSRTAACHGSPHRNKMIGPHLLKNTGHRGRRAKARAFVLDWDHWYLGRRKRRRRRSYKHLEGSAVFRVWL